MKTAISIPNNVFEQAESLARKLKISRSELFTEAVKVYLKENHVEDVTAKLNEVYENAALNLDNDLLKAQTASLLQIPTTSKCIGAATPITERIRFLCGIGAKTVASTSAKSLSPARKTLTSPKCSAGNALTI